MKNIHTYEMNEKHTYVYSLVINKANYQNNYKLQFLSCEYENNFLASFYY